MRESWFDSCLPPYLDSGTFNTRRFGEKEKLSLTDLRIIIHKDLAVLDLIYSIYSSKEFLWQLL
ncbi:hypothetical protein SAMN05216332_101559 [Nitrosospira briensis]|nr:hypothetical protein SAMN05216332_101559 [Nitrosospira briensis]